MTIQATDHGYPARNSSNTARVTVRITRNRREPEFDDDPYSLAIEETLDVGKEVMRMTATDSDSEVGLLKREISYFLFSTENFNRFLVTSSVSFRVLYGRI